MTFTMCSPTLLLTWACWKLSTALLRATTTTTTTTITTTTLLLPTASSSTALPMLLRLLLLLLLLLPAAAATTSGEHSTGFICKRDECDWGSCKGMLSICFGQGGILRGRVPLQLSMLRVHSMRFSCPGCLAHRALG